jgi:hypothetical protein
MAHRKNIPHTQKHKGLDDSQKHSFINVVFYKAGQNQTRKVR